MADDNLDDFFAKKDKSKKKSKSSKLTPSDILTKTDETEKKGKKSKKDKDKTQTTNSSNATDGSGLIEEEWHEVVEEQEKDYTGLRIANLQASETVDDGEQGGEDEAEDGDEDGEGQERKDRGKQGPWEAGGQPPPAVVAPSKPAPVAEDPSKPKEEPAASKTPGKYISPGMRAAAASGGTPSSGPTLPGHIRKKKAAPNLGSEMDFPTLGGGPGSYQSDGDSRNFEEVQHGGRQLDNVSSKVAQQLSLGNKFSALQD